MTGPRDKALRLVIGGPRRLANLARNRTFPLRFQEQAAAVGGEAVCRVSRGTWVQRGVEVIAHDDGGEAPEPFELVISERARIGTGVRFDFWPRRGGKIEIGPRATIGPYVHVVLRGGSLSVGPDSAVRAGSALRVHGGRLELGTNVVIAEAVSVHCLDRISIGDFSGISHGSLVTDMDHIHEGDERSFMRREPVTGRVEIGTNVWVGAQASILRGVEIGDNSVVGAGALVADDLPEGHLSVGAPARPLKPLGRHR